MPGAAAVLGLTAFSEIDGLPVKNIFRGRAWIEHAAVP